MKKLNLSFALERYVISWMELLTVPATSCPVRMNHFNSTFQLTKNVFILQQISQISAKQIGRSIYPSTLILTAYSSWTVLIQIYVEFDLIGRASLPYSTLFIILYIR
jgi:hypothetical protein